MDYKQLSFPKKQVDFFSTLQTRVREHFEDIGKSKHGNMRMFVKTACMLSMYLAPYFLMLFGVVPANWFALLAWAVMGFGMAGIGLSVMHDAIHGAYSKNQTVNNIVGYVINIIGGNHVNWKLQHNVLHHSFTNVDGVDEDINPGNFLRFSPHQERRAAHKLQHLYAWPLYGLMTILWITTKDFKQMLRYKRTGMIKQIKKPFSVLFSELITMKTFYYIYALIIPLIFFPSAWYITLIGFFIMHFICGLLLAAIFQAAHVMPTSEYPLPNDEGQLENNWAIHQMLTTTNFSPNSRVFSWFVGGLNFQIEHHLFPNICHVHYKRISKIVKETAQEFGLPYNSQPNFVKAVIEHSRMLYRLGHQDNLAF